jgi:heme-degrading monooxygenase HmoA
VRARGAPRSLVVIWEFRVPLKKRRAFERAYGTKGDWARLFRKESGYIRTDLIRDLNSAGRYVTLDYWRTRRHYERFKDKNREAYLMLDQKCEMLTSKEIRIGEFGIEA